MMKIFSILILFCTFACGAKNDDEKAITPAAKDTIAAAVVSVPDTFEHGKLIANVLCKTDPSQSYAIYIPAKKQEGLYAVIYFFDPHGDGTLPLAKYKNLAEQYGFILAGSNNSKNGNDFFVAENIWTNLFYDTKSRLKIDMNRIYTCGFSGGAKVAGYIALKHPEIKGVIAGGAGLPDATAPANFRFTYTGIAGKGDMNMTDLVAFNAALDNTETKHRLILFEGKHEWAPENIMNIAFAGLQFDAMREKTIPVDERLINNYVNNSKKKTGDYIQKHKLLEAEEECRLSIHLLDELTKEREWFKQQDISVTKSTDYQQQFEANQSLLSTEQTIKAQYMQQFQQADLNYWTKTIHDLRAKSNPSTAEGAMYERLVAYLSLAFYSISNQMISNHRDKEAQYFVELYKLDDPTNNEAWYFSALVNARNNNLQGVKNDLAKAIENGFNDKARLENQPEFRSLSINYAEMESKMKK